MPPTKLSPELQKLLRKNPLASRAENDRVARGDLELAVKRYAELARAEGPDGSSWAVYFAIEGELGRAFEASVRAQSPAACESLARWGFEQGREMLAVLAYERFLEEGSTTPLAEDAQRYVACVESDDGPGAAEAARALVAKRTGAATPAAAKPTAQPAARAPAPPPARPAPPPAAAAPLARPATTTPAAVPIARPAPAPTRARPGMRPMVVTSFSPHSFAGFDLTMPACGACAAQLRCYFAFDVESDAMLGALLPKWALLPLVGCEQCDVWRFRHNYAIDKDGTELSLLGVDATSEQLFGVTRREPPKLPRHNVGLSAASPASPATAIQIAGDPLFLREPLTPECPRCYEAMAFVANLAEPFGFPVKLGLTGCHYHFACANCRILSVIAQT